MRLEFEDVELERLAYDVGASTKRWPPDVTRAYRRRIQQIAAANDDRDLRAVKSLHLEKLRGDRAGTHSIRINQKYRLIVRFTTTPTGRTTVIVDGLDYH